MLNERNTLLEDDGIEEEILVEEECSVAQAVWGDIQGNIENQTDLQNALDAKQDSLTEAQLSAVNSGITAEKVTTYDGYADQIASKADQSALNAESIARGEADMALGTRIDNEALARQQADNGLQSQIDAITSKSDVVDVVANYAALQAYDTSTLGNNDVVKVLDDETHEDALTYYRWSTTTQTWSYIGQEAPYYSKGQMDVKLAEKQDKLTAGANIQIQNGTISATDTTYTAGNGLNLNGTEFSADTDVLATKTDLDSYYTKPETDNLLAPKLEAEVVTELPTTGEEGKLYLTPKAHTTTTATGNPIEATVTEQAGQLESFQLDGDTFQQSYTGKNLCDYTAATYPYSGNGITAELNDDGSITVTGLPTKDYIVIVLQDITDIIEDGAIYTISCDNYGADFYLDIVGVKPGGGFGYPANTRNGSASFTVDKTTFASYQVRIETYTRASWGEESKTVTRKFQLEKGSTASSYEPFVGGQPSPSPDYPQPIQTVTGEQTVTINSTAYPISLGSIELCKLGTYQDYIWKDGEDWKIHKATNKVILDGSESWSRWITPDENTIETRAFTLKKSFFGELVPYFSPYAGIVNTAKSDRFTVRNTVWDNVVLTCCALNGDGTRCLQVKLEKTYLEYSDSMTTAELEALFKAWLVNKPTTLYYALATATDTTITDQTLIAQLEAIRTASLENGTNTITNTATAPNLAGDMEIGYYGFNPTNRYDKFIWLDLNNNYEQIGGE